MNQADLLTRIAATMRADVGPAVDDEYAKTQAFMAAVVLQKVARELVTADAHRAANDGDYRALADDLDAELGSIRAVPGAVTAAMTRFRDDHSSESLSELIAALYTTRSELGATFAPLLSRVRRTLRAVLDRRLESAR
jgi:hypothetical protein